MKESSKLLATQLFVGLTIVALLLAAVLSLIWMRNYDMNKPVPTPTTQSTR